MPIPTVALATDEDLALRLGEDYATLAPRSGEIVASGNDGSFLTGDRWTLGSATNDCVAQGVLPGMVALVAVPKRTGLAPDVQALAIQAVGSLGMTLRRKKMPAGVGQPPAPAGGSGGVQFTVVTLLPALCVATYDLDRKYGIDDALAGRRTLDLYDADELRAACVLTVLWKLYQSAAKQGSADAKDGESATLWAKAKSAQAELDDVLARLALRWQSLSNSGVASPPTMRTMRVSR